MVRSATRRVIDGVGVGTPDGRPDAGHPPRDRRDYGATLVTLSEASTDRHFEAFTDIEWDAPAMAVVADDERWILSKADILGAHPWYQALPKARRIQIGRHRLAAITKTGSQFEQLLLLGGTDFLMRLRNGNPEFRYFMHELTEETHHIQMFQEFTNRTCPEVAGAPAWLMKAIPYVARLGGRFPALFFSIILAGEEPIDHVQKDIMRTGGVHPLLDRIMAIHIAEEARHIGFAHAWLEQHSPNLGPIDRFLLGVLTPLTMRLGADAIVRPSKADRRMMGIPRSVARDVWGNDEQSAKFRRDLFSDVRMLFDDLGMRTRATRWAWKLAGVDGRPARFRAEPAAAAH